LLQARLERNELAVAFAQELIAELGRVRAIPILARAINRMQSEAARALAGQLGDNSLAALGEYFRRRAREQGILEVLEASEQRLTIRILRCPSTEAFRRLGLDEIAPLFCASDHAFIRAFNPQIRLSRTQTIARGGACCDHVWEEEEGT